ncbi:DHHC palmitoyltransferase-domain-containing protein [Lipomyces japonicus]|uniref:DHHC palmitoyltransferase-domain-containing protein n=1 Tax=Lipomyces japonicus TaxID=56871 RepID=UPI0034CE8F51
MVYQLKWRSLGVVIPVSLIFTLGYVSDWLILRRHFDTSYRARHHVRIGLVWLTYALSVLVHPGSPPANFEPAEHALDHDDDDGDGKLPVLRKFCTFCRKCNRFKPPRAHHCRVCNTCVLRMDHHCPWTMNCVGHRNLLHFVRFLVMVTYASAVLLAALLARIAALWNLRHEPVTAGAANVAEITATVVLTPACLIVLFSVGVLAIRTIWNACLNITLIECWEKERVEGQIRRGRLAPVEFPYDLGGPFDNLVAALGPAWSWVLPWTQPPGDGMSFEVNEQQDDDMPWPPPDPDEVSAHTYSDRRLPLPAVRRQQVIDHHASSSSSSSTSSFFYSQSGLSSRPPDVTSTDVDNDHDATDSASDEGTSADEYWRRDKWQSWEGERLADFGVDVGAETVVPAVDDDDVPLGIIQRKLTTTTAAADASG